MFLFSYFDDFLFKDLFLFFSLSTLKSIKNLYRNTEKSQGETL